MQLMKADISYKIL